MGGPMESLQQLLKNQSRHKNRSSRTQARRQRFDFRARRNPVTPQRQGPNARVDEDVHRRERSTL